MTAPLAASDYGQGPPYEFVHLDRDRARRAIQELQAALDELGSVEALRRSLANRALERWRGPHADHFVDDLRSLAGQLSMVRAGLRDQLHQLQAALARADRMDSEIVHANSAPGLPGG